MEDEIEHVGCFSGAEVQLRPNAKFVFQAKHVDGENKIDFRLWASNERSKGVYFPTRKGVFIDAELFKEKILPIVISALDYKVSAKTEKTHEIKATY